MPIHSQEHHAAGTQLLRGGFEVRGQETEAGKFTDAGAAVVPRDMMATHDGPGKIADSAAETNQASFPDVSSCLAQVRSAPKTLHSHGRGASFTYTGCFAISTHEHFAALMQQHWPAKWPICTTRSTHALRQLHRQFRVDGIPR